MNKGDWSSVVAATGDEQEKLVVDSISSKLFDIAGDRYADFN